MDAYFNLSGVTYSTALYIGTANTSYYSTRHVDAGYEEAERCAEDRGVRVPGLNY